MLYVQRYAHTNAQMPIVNGMTSCKLIRSFEKTHANALSPRAATCGRIPIIAVSASLVEKSRQVYIDAGFDAWILKPISFPRLSELMAAIVDPDIRRNCLYVPGEWEQGGWFHDGTKSASDTSTVPSTEPPETVPSKPMDTTTTSDNPTADNDGERIPEEQDRLLQTQEKGKEKIADGDNGDISAADPPPPTES